MVTEHLSDTRSRLMESALLLFAERNFEGVGIREIAAKAGVNSALVQYHFGGKEGLYMAAMRWVDDMMKSIRPPFPPLPVPGDPQAREIAIAALQGYIRIILEQFLTCHGFGDRLPIPFEVARAAHELWNREMEAPRPAMREFILGVVRPHQAYLDTCIQTLRPDLSEEDVWLMGLSIHGQVIFLHKHLQLVQLMRGQGFGPENLDVLHRHFVDFSLRGLGIPVAPVS